MYGFGKQGWNLLEPSGNRGGGAEDPFTPALSVFFLLLSFSIVSSLLLLLFVAYAI